MSPSKAPISKIFDGEIHRFLPRLLSCTQKVYNLVLP